MTNHLGLVLALTGLCVACTGDVHVDLPTVQEELPVRGVDAGSRVAPCDQAPDGTSCGLERHCIFNACVDNACGDGLVNGREGCDDGNERNGDGCDERCMPEAPPDAGTNELADGGDAGE